MNIKIIIAPEGSGKTQYILKEFLNNSYKSMVLTQYHLPFIKLIPTSHAKYKRNVFVYNSTRYRGYTFDTCYCDDYFLVNPEIRKDFFNYIHALGLKNIIIVSSSKNPLLKAPGVTTYIQQAIKDPLFKTENMDFAFMLNEVLYEVPSSFIRYKKASENFVLDLKDILQSFVALGENNSIIHKESLKDLI